MHANDESCDTLNTQATFLGNKQINKSLGSFFFSSSMKATKYTLLALLRDEIKNKRFRGTEA